MAHPWCGPASECTSCAHNNNLHPSVLGWAGVQRSAVATTPQQSDVLDALCIPCFATPVPVASTPESHTSHAAACGQPEFARLECAPRALPIKHSDVSQGIPFSPCTAPTGYTKGNGHGSPHVSGIRRFSESPLSSAGSEQSKQVLSNHFQQCFCGQVHLEAVIEATVHPGVLPYGWFMLLEEP